MAWVEEPKLCSDGSWRIAIRSRVGGAGSRYTREWLYAETRERCLNMAAVKVQMLDDRRRLGRKDAHPPTIEQFAALWLTDQIRPQNADKTYTAYVHIVQRYLLPFCGQKRIDKFYPGDALALRNSIQQTARASARSQDGRAAADKALTVIKGMFNWAVKLHVIDPPGPFSAVRAFKYAPDDVEADYAPTPEHVAVLRAIVLYAKLSVPLSEERRRDSALILSLLGYEALRQEDIERASLGQALYPSGEPRDEFIIFKGKTPAATRRPELWEQPRAELAELAARRRPLDMESPLIAGERGGAFARRNWQRDVWQEVRDIAIRTRLTEIPGAPRDIEDIPSYVKPHMLRRCGATMMAYAGIEMHTVRDHLGHEQDTTTLSFYTKRYPSARRRRLIPMEEQIEQAEAFAARPEVRAAIDAAVAKLAAERAEAAKQAAEA